MFLCIFVKIFILNQVFLTKIEYIDSLCTFLIKYLRETKLYCNFIHTQMLHNILTCKIWYCNKININVYRYIKKNLDNFNILLAIDL